MSVVITTGDKSKEYFLNQIGSVCCSGGGTNGSGLYLSDGKIIDGNGKDVTDEVDNILAATISVGDMIVDYEEKE